MGTQPPTPKGAQPLLQFSANVRCGPVAGWTKMPLGMEVGLGPGDIVLDMWTQLTPLPRKSQLPNVRPMSIVAKQAVCIRIPLGKLIRRRGRPQPRRHCVRWVPCSSPSPKGTPHSPQFSAMSVLAKRLDGPRCHLVRR